MAKKYALLVGVSEYSDPKFARLNAPAADVAALAAALEEPGIASFDSVVRLVEPNREQVVVGLVNLFADKGRDDLVLLYSSGHGVRNIRDKLFLALGKTRFDWPLGSSIAAAELKHYMDDCDSQRQVLILDCCYAGAFMGPHRGGASAPVLTEGTFEVRGYGREVLTATNESGLAFDGGEVRDDDGTVRQLGKFTRFLVEGLRTGAGIADRDEITVTDLFEHARRGLAAEDPRMRPQHWRERGEAPLVIARNRQARPRLPDELLAALGDKSDPVRRRGAVDWLDDLIRNVDPRLRAAALRELRRCEPGEENRFVHQRMLLVLQRVDTTVPETPAPAAPAVLRPKSELDWPRARLPRRGRRSRRRRRTTMANLPTGRGRWASTGSGRCRWTSPGSRPTRSACTMFTATSGSWSRTPGTTHTKARLRTDRRGWKRAAGRAASCAAVPGSWGPGSLCSAFRLKVSPRGGTSSIGFRVARMLMAGPHRVIRGEC
jgi:hypothetical protein